MQNLLCNILLPMLLHMLRHWMYKLQQLCANICSIIFRSCVPILMYVHIPLWACPSIHPDLAASMASFGGFAKLSKTGKTVYLHVYPGTWVQNSTTNSGSLMYFEFWVQRGTILKKIILLMFALKICKSLVDFFKFH